VAYCVVFYDDYDISENVAAPILRVEEFGLELYFDPEDGATTSIRNVST
jgi:hypothetical protein